jgi:hypothetical protein
MDQDEAENVPVRNPGDFEFGNKTLRLESYTIPQNVYFGNTNVRRIRTDLFALRFGKHTVTAIQVEVERLRRVHCGPAQRAPAQDVVSIGELS